LLPWLAFTI